MIKDVIAYKLSWLRVGRRFGTVRSHHSRPLVSRSRISPYLLVQLIAEAITWFRLTRTLGRVDI